MAAGVYRVSGGGAGSARNALNQQRLDRPHDRTCVDAASSSVRAPLGFDPRALAEVNAEASLSPLSDSLTRGIFGQGDDRPNIYGVMTTSLSIMQDRLTRSRLAGDPPDLQINPRVGHIGLLEFERAEEAIREGEIAVERMRPELMDALQVMGLRASL